MPLPTAAELTDPNATNTQMKENLGGLAQSLRSIINEKRITVNGSTFLGSFNLVTKKIETFNKWMSCRLDFTGDELNINGLFACHYASSVRIPAVTFFDKNDNVISALEYSDADAGKTYVVDAKIPKNSSYALLSFSTIGFNGVPNNLEAYGSFAVLKKENSGTTLDIKAIDILEKNGIGLLDSFRKNLKGLVDDPVVFVGQQGNYQKTGAYALWYCSKVDLNDAVSVKGTSFSYRNANASVTIPAIIVFNSSDEIVRYIDASRVTEVDAENFEFNVTPDMAYMYVQYLNNQEGFLEVNYSSEKLPSILERISELEKKNYVNLNLDLLIPKNVYNVANDIDFKTANQVYTGSRSELKRNYSSVLYLDNFIDYIESEPSIRFDNNGVKKIIPAYSPWIEQQAIENPNLNGGLSIYEETVNFKIIGNKEDSQTVSIKNRSVLNSATKDKTPTILIIGDSVSFGQDAYFPGGKDKWNYTMILNRMFANDKMQNGGAGYNFRTVGTVAYTDKDGNKSFNEAYSGTTMNWLFNYYKFLDSNNNFSLQNWLNKYRTCDDNGNRLYFTSSQGTTGIAGEANKGYLADGSDSGLLIGNQVTNTMSFDVYKPTHVFCFHASNSPVTEADYNLFISKVKATLPNAIIGLGVPRVAGTFFPSQYPNVVESEIWKYEQGYNRNHVATLKVLIDKFWNNTNEVNKVFVIPTFWVNPAAEAFSSIYVNSPHIDIFDDGERIEMAAGQRRDVHVGSRAQAAYAYQLYAWLKWTAVNSLF